MPNETHNWIPYFSAFKLFSNMMYVTQLLTSQSCKLRRVRVTIFVGEKGNWYYIFRVCVCVCSLSYPACKAHSPCYIEICVPSGCTVFSQIIS